MVAVIVDPTRVRPFESEAAFEKWLAKNHEREPEVWIKIHKKASGLASITPIQAIDVCLCWGWIDAIRKGFDETSFLQRYTPRGKKSIWSQINVDNVARLVAAGRMTPHGRKHVDAAKADGRWARAYAPIREKTLPEDLQRAIDASPAAVAMLEKLDSTNRFALGFRVGNLKTAAGRAAKIEAFVAMLARGESLFPLKQVQTKKAAAAATPEAGAAAKKPESKKRAPGKPAATAEPAAKGIAKKRAAR